MKHDIIFKFTHEAWQYIFVPDSGTDYAFRKRKINISENYILYIWRLQKEPPENNFSFGLQIYIAGNFLKDLPNLGY